MKFLNDGLITGVSAMERRAGDIFHWFNPVSVLTNQRKKTKEGIVKFTFHEGGERVTSIVNRET